MAEAYTASLPAGQERIAVESVLSSVGPLSLDSSDGDSDEGDSDQPARSQPKVVHGSAPLSGVWTRGCVCLVCVHHISRAYTHLSHSLNRKPQTLNPQS